jgi:hypothetical protein
MFSRVSAQQVQLIHNAADPAAANVDVWFSAAGVPGQQLLQSNFGFRTATPYQALLPGTYTVFIKAPGSTAASPALYQSNPITLGANDTTIIIANGNVGNNFSINPNGVSTDFDLYLIDGRIGAPAGTFNLNVFHGATDAPGVDAFALTNPGQLQILDDLQYTSVSGYLNLPVADYRIGLTANGSTNLLGIYTAPLATLNAGGLSGLVFASGYLTPSANSNGPAFKLMVALQNGTVLELPQQTAKLQAIHNSADPAVQKVDINIQYENLLVARLEGVEYTQATPYLDLPSGLGLDVSFLASGNSTPLVTFEDITLTEGNAFVAMAHGVTAPGNFNSSVNGNIAFTLSAVAGKTISNSPTNVDVLAFHGSTDAPTVNVGVSIGGSVAGTLTIPYGEFTNGYTTLPATDARLIVSAAPNGTPIVGYFDAPLSLLGGQAVVVFASGFLDPRTNQNGEVFKLFAALPDGQVVELPQPSAKIQVIHNAPDPAAANVDLTLLAGPRFIAKLQNVPFRGATPYLDLPADLPYTVQVSAPGSSAVLASFDVTPEAGETYLAIANGVLNPAQFASAGNNIAFKIDFFAGQAQSSGGTGTAEAFIYHGATDAPAVDLGLLDATGNNTLATISGLAYGENIPYTALPLQNLLISVGASPNNAPIVGAWKANLTQAGGAAIVVMASGFLDPRANQNGQPFGLFAVDPSGNVIPLPAATAKLQAIHNSADPAANKVDIVVKAGPRFIAKLDNIEFRKATPYLDLPALTDLSLEFYAAGTSTLAGTVPVGRLTLDGSFVGIATGVLGTQGFNTSVNSNINFTVAASSGQQAASAANKVAVKVYHGSTDAPAVDVTVAANNTPVSGLTNLSYGNFSNYIELDLANYRLAVTPAGANTTKVVVFDAPLQTLNAGGAAMVVFASGFLDSTANKNGAAFALFAALPDGTVLRLPEPRAAVQLIHNSPDPAAATVNVRITAGPRLIGRLNGVGFRKATPFLNMPAGVALKIELLAGETPAASFDNITFTEANFVGVVDGVLTPANFERPAGRNIALTLNSFTPALLQAPQANRVAVLVHHGSTDAPAVDVYARGVAQPLVSNLDYGNFSSNYLVIEPANYVLELTGAGSPTRVAAYVANLTANAGRALVVFASGVFTPAGDPANAAGFGLFVALADGTVAQLQSTDLVSIDELQGFDAEFVVYPNPATTSLNIRFNLTQTQPVTLGLIDMQGRTVLTHSAGQLNAGSHVTQLNTNNLPNGLYTLTVNGRAVGKASVVR